MDNTNTANFNTFMGQNLSPDDLAAIQKLANEQAQKTQELLKLQKQVTDDKISQLKGESEDEKRARKLREAREYRIKKIEDREIADYEKDLKRDEETTKRKKTLHKLEDENLERETSAAEKIKKSPILDVLPENIQNAKPKDEKKEPGFFSKINESYKQVVDAVKEKKKQQEDGEQKNLGEANRVSFNPEGIKILKTLLIPLYTGLNVGALDKKLEELIEGQKEIVKNTKPKGGLLDILGKLLLIGGVAATLVGVFWDKIKPWLEEKLSRNLDFFDKFRGIVEGIGKFFTMGGLKLTLGGAFNVIGGVIKSFGELIETGLTVAFKSLFSGGAAAGEAAGGIAKAGTSFKGLLPKIAAGLFKGIGVTVLKGIPVIGGLISLGFAASRFKSGDYVGGIIDLVGGIANFLELIPGLGLIPMAISLGAAALNAFLDVKAGGEPDSQGKKLGAIGGLFVGFWNFLKKIPVIGSIITFAEGTGQFFKGLFTNNFGDIKTGIEKMANIPVLGIALTPILALLDSVKVDDKGNRTGIDTSSIWKNLKLRVGKTILSWFSWLPKSWQKGIADFMGVPFEGGDEKEEGSDTGTSPAEKQLANKKAELANFNSQHGEKGGDKKKREELENAVKNAQSEFDKTKSPEKLEEEKYQKLKDDYQSKNKDFEKFKEEWKEREPVANDWDEKNIAMLKAKKALIDYEKNKKEVKPTPSIITEQQPKPNSTYEPAPDNLNTSTPDDKMTKIVALQNNINQRLMQQLSNMGKSIEKPDTKNTTIINNTENKKDNKEYLFKPIRDPIFEIRSGWYGHAINYRSTY
jgi:hypothetical protein